MIAKQNNRAGNHAAYLIAASFGVLSGLGGLQHGPGEILQGSTHPQSLYIESWTQGPIYQYMGGEPAITILPTFLSAGILTVIFSLAVIIWSAFFVQRKSGGLIQLLLVIGMLLVGGGIAPPILGIIASTAGMSIHAGYGGWRNRLSGRFGRMMAQIWPWLYAIGLVNGLFLTVGSVILVYTISFNAPDTFVYSFFFAALTLIIIILTGIAYDVQQFEQSTT